MSRATNSDVGRSGGDQITETIIRIDPESISAEQELTSSSRILQHNDDTEPHIHNALIAGGSSGVRSWRMNLNNVLSFSTTPIRTEALRSLISHSNSFRHTPLNAENPALSATSRTSGDNNDSVHILMHQDIRDATVTTTTSPNIWRMNTHRSSNEERNHSSNDTVDSHSDNDATRMNLPYSATAESFEHPSDDSEAARLQEMTPLRNGGENSNNMNSAEPNDISNGVVRVLSMLARYLPFICIIFAKFIHDHLWAILDLLLLHAIMYQVNKSLREQIAKFSQKSYTILIRDFSLIICTVAYRILLSSTSPDPFGLLIPPPKETVILEMPTNAKVAHNGGAAADILATKSPGEKSTATLLLQHQIVSLVHVQQQQVTDNPLDTLEDAVALTKAISLGVLLYYVAVNDLVLKLLTVLIKIAIAMLPTKVIRHKPKARMFVLVEYFAQFYRTIVPVRQWLFFLFESYSGIEVISGVLFSSFYMGAKGFEIVDRGKALRKAFTNFIRNMDYERKPTKDELESAGPLCPICHDIYSTPIVLECGHIFCDDCVSTWFKREQTCPMCRAKAIEDPIWQDGSTSFFYQLC